MALSEHSKTKQGELLDSVGRASIMGLHMVSGLIVGVLLGYALDHWLDTFPWGAGVGLLLGIGAGFRNVWIDAKHLIQEGERDHAAHKPPED